MYREGVATIILNQNNEILLVNLTSFEKHFFAIPGGGIDKDETKVETIKRELFEELGIKENSIKIIKESRFPIKFEFKTKPLIRNGHKYIGQIKYYFLVRYIGNNSDIKVYKKEVRKYVWCNYMDLNRYLLFENQLDDTIKIISDICPEIIN